MAFKKNLFYPSLIFAAAAASYANSLANGFVWDDLFLVVSNPLIRGWANTPRLFVSGYWTAVTETSGGLYRPLTMLSFSLEEKAVGLSPFLFHLDNLLLHAACSVLAFLLLKAMLKEDRAAFYAALLFAALPVHAEAVAWVSGRAEVLAASLMLLSAYLFVERPDSSARRLLSAVIFFLALLAKETSAVLPLLLLGYFLIFVNRDKLRDLLLNIFRLWPFAAAFLLYLSARLYVLGAMGPQGKGQMLAHESTGGIFLIMAKALAHYIRLSFLPFDLRVDYDFPAPPFLSFGVLFSIVIVVLVIVFHRRILAFSRPASFGLFWFFACLLPVSNIIPIGIIMSERALYLPSLGACLILGAALASARSRSRYPAASVVALTGITSFFFLNTALRNPTWKDEASFGLVVQKALKERIQRFPDRMPYYLSVANMLMERGNAGPEPEADIKYVLAAYPNYADAHTMMGILYLRRSLPGEALKEAEAAISLGPDAGPPYAVAAAALHIMRRDGEAVAYLDRGLKADPACPELYLNFGCIYLDGGEYDRALAMFNKASRLNPAYADPLFEEGVALGSAGRFNEAVGKLKISLMINPDQAQARYYLAAAYLGTNRPDLARKELEEALRLKPDYAEAKELLGKIK